MACRRLCEVANAPQLNASTSLYVPWRAAQTAPAVAKADVQRVLSFCRWLAARGAGSVQRLSLRMREVQLTAGEALALGVALGACGSALRRAQLFLPADLLHGLGSWVAALRNLRVLNVGGPPEPPCDITCSLAPLAQLEDLTLDCISVASTASLPCSLTRLHLDCDWRETMPQQVWDGREEDRRMPALIMLLQAAGVQRCHVSSLPIVFTLPPSCLR